MTRSLQSWVQQQQGKYLLRHGLSLIQKGNLNGAIETLTRALAFHPQPQEVHLKRGVAYFQQDAFAEALADFNQAIALDPQDARAYGHRGLVRYQMDDEDGALEDWAMALSLQPGEADVRYNRGLIFAQKKQYEAALADFDVAIDKNPLLAEAYLHRGKVKQELGDSIGAVKDWELALCNDLRLDEAHHLLAKTQEKTENVFLQDQFADLLPDGFWLTAEQQGTLLVLTLHRPVGTPINYFKLPNTLRDRLVELQIPEVRRFRLVAKAGESSLSEWDQTYGIYDKAPCPPSRWRDAFATTLLLFPPFGVVALVLAAQVKPAYRRGDYPIAARASQAVRKLCLSSGAIMGLMLFGLASYGVYTHVEGEYPNPGAKTAFVESSESTEKKL
ncbi:tetratricopeptide repeat protein [Oscillatoria sp. CS-180]|uniref:tetratricopeptide repeat protein n=1 Tax=Oscillatoria sp. CS-180 TaxID=3021720 RepID=UPI0023309E7C|nr:tetratricopeptide repeat protein [Oscillatoria sp. CS-180]MDB9525653.1 tetratricopeptide repeat protein [Oscillatoria sp. CS-180]